MYEELLECRTCGVIGSRDQKLCRPVALFDTCLDHTQRRDLRVREPCESIQVETSYRCAVCNRPSVEALNVCYPRQIGEPEAGKQSSPSTVKPPAR